VNANRTLTAVAALGCVLAIAACDPTGPSRRSHTVSPSASAALPARVSAVIATDHGPGGFTVTSDAVYVGNHRGGTVQRIDPSTNRISSTILVGGELSIPIATDPVDPADPLWVCTNVDGTLRQVDLRAGRVMATVQTNCDGGWHNVIDGQVWAVSGGDAPDVSVIDVHSGKVLRSYPVDRYSGPPMPAGGRVLIGSGESGVTLAFGPSGGKPARIAVETPWLWSAGGRLYRMPSDGTLAELDPTTLATVRTYHVPPHNDGDPALVADDAGHLYYRPDYTHLYRVDIASGTVDMFLQLPWEETPTGLAWGFGSLWVTNFDQDTVWRVNTTL